MRKALLIDSREEFKNCIFPDLQFCILTSYSTLSTNTCWLIIEKAYKCELSSKSDYLIHISSQTSARYPKYKNGVLVDVSTNITNVSFSSTGELSVLIFFDGNDPIYLKYKPMIMSNDGETFKLGLHLLYSEMFDVLGLKNAHALLNSDSYE